MIASSSDGARRYAGTVLYRTIEHSNVAVPRPSEGAMRLRNTRSARPASLQLRSAHDGVENIQKITVAVIVSCGRCTYDISQEKLMGPALLAYCSISIFLFSFEFPTPFVDSRL
jgi:hypothetical protein